MRKDSIGLNQTSEIDLQNILALNDIDCLSCYFT
jgi:hypothetical protein